ncbi:lytic polysaccharide monooxygenase [Alkalihalobacillus hemicellulosilyticus]|uniref:Chitin binding protein n=1 Tax=Halalkalibacter hemicellulosilyticusJCM 9152 TaxID=1236971 RepID=W4QLS0_9BACI|nr:lytic polysaccharide monooxygenase [Halalkalibacter hemicellulosilyticus]GAE32847.1 chitin binding protein [Halalkalibacter hemicellulosilyticusJCM 9152]
MFSLKMKKKIRMVGVTIVALGLFSFVGAQAVSAHGYVENPGARGLLCSQGINLDCGGIVWEPQSLEGPKGFPEAGVADGQIASAGGVFPKLDEQSADRWAKVDLSSGANSFTWHLTARHSTAKWHYYITKPDWNPNEPLTRQQFDLVPFYEQYDGGARPEEKVTHDVTIPERSGYHVILAVWDVADTANAFYNVIDVNFSGGTNPDPGPGPDPDPNPDPQYPVWSPTTVYLNGDRVTFNGNVYEAKWWTLGETPGNAYVWTLIE